MYVLSTPVQARPPRIYFPNYISMIHEGCRRMPLKVTLLSRGRLESPLDCYTTRDTVVLSINAFSMLVAFQETAFESCFSVMLLLLLLYPR